MVISEGCLLNPVNTFQSLFYLLFHLSLYLSISLSLSLYLSHPLFFSLTCCNKSFPKYILFFSFSSRATTASLQYPSHFFSFPFWSHPYNQVLPVTHYSLVNCTTFSSHANQNMGVICSFFLSSFYHVFLLTRSLLWFLSWFTIRNS